MKSKRLFSVLTPGLRRLVGTSALAVALSALPGTPAAAQESALVQMDPVIVTARGYAASQSETPGSIGVATADDITVAPKGSLVEAVSRLPGISRTGDSPWGQDISIRGLSGPSVVVLVDGKRINTATDMNARLGFINPMDIERIEVLKGPISALYGSGSTGGVINIITRKGSFTPEAEIHGRIAGSVSSNAEGGSGYVNVSANSESFWGMLTAGLRDYDDSYGGERERVVNSSFADGQARAAVGIRSGDLTVTLQGMHSEGDHIGIPGGVSSLPSLGLVEYPRTGFTFASADFSLDVGGEYLKALEADIYYTRNTRRVMVSNTGTSVRFINPNSEHETVGGKIQGYIEAGDHTITAGADVWSWKITTWRNRQLPAGPLLDKPTPDARQTSVGIFAEDNWILNDEFSLNLGARLDGMTTRNDAHFLISPPLPGSSRKLYDSNDQFNLGWHLHAGLTWNMTEAWSQSFLLASSYRAADLLERFKYINLGGGRELWGNPDIDPEQSYYAEYGLRYATAPFTADLRLFANFVTDYIAEKQVNATTIKLENVDDARIYGAELEGRWNLAAHWSLYGSISALYGDDEEKNQPLSGIAPVSGTLGIEFTHDIGLWARLESVMTARQNRTPRGVDDCPGYMTLNFAGGFAFDVGATHHEISVGVDNLLDAQYYNYLANTRGYDVWEPGISFFANYAIDF